VYVAEIMVYYVLMYCVKQLVVIDYFFGSLFLVYHGEELVLLFTHLSFTTFGLY
jgi:hypothetical protein